MVRYNVFTLSRRRIVALISTTTFFAFAIWFINHFLPYKNVWTGFDTNALRLRITWAMAARSG